MEYLILFIDEESDTHNDFRRYIDKYNRFNPDITLKCETLLPASTIDEMREIVFQYSPDAVVTDFQLNAKKPSVDSPNVTYTGAEFVHDFVAVRAGFPCFIITSFDGEAADASPDVNLVYVKTALSLTLLKDSGGSDELSFAQRIVKQISKYKKQIEQSEIRFQTLLDKQKNGNNLTCSEEQELVSLDTFLEASIDGRAAIPNKIKELSNINKLNDLLKSVNELLNECKK